jgi:protein-S-isoprenylcysteine O-methyltransferase Ste14
VIDMLVSAAAGLFGISEVAFLLLMRARARVARRDDRGSLGILWLAIGLGIAVAVASTQVRLAEIRAPLAPVRLAALCFLASGLAIRWTAMLTLGRQFTVDVAVRHDHALVQRGLYRLVRHPSYSGLLLAFVGTGLLYDNWLSLAGLMLPIVLAVLNRIAKEERALLAAFGAPYAAYCARTKRLVPGLI